MAGGNRSDAIRIGMQRARLHGRMPGRPNKGESKWSEIQALLDEGVPIGDIAELTGLSLSTVKRVIRRHDR